MSEQNGEHVRLEKSIDSLASSVSSLVEKHGESSVVLARIDERVNGLQEQGCLAGDRMTRDVHRRIDRQRNVTGLGVLIAGAVAGAITWIKGGG